jgi:hypothetical protein
MLTFLQWLGHLAAKELATLAFLHPRSKSHLLATYHDFTCVLWAVVGYVVVLE